MKKSFTCLFAIISILTFSHCKKDTIPEPNEIANIMVKMNFNHLLNHNPVEMDTIKYVNSNTDTFSIRTIKYFISRVTFHRDNKADIVLKDFHYVDQELPESLTHIFKDLIPEDSYSSVSFTFGFTNTDNTSNMFTTAPEMQMFWPENMGGGYHYQKLEGQYLDHGIKKFFNFHAGGLDKIDYSIHIQLANSNFQVKNDQVQIDLNMEIQNWFKNPVNWDFSYFGAAIMQNHEAQQTIQKNGHDVFTASIHP
ncbi:hypothetical protein KFE94_09140 [bacterium SCSIO 12643]|nr:hypothetical protein KFE94_09140 [bacterium SCSIO 12643]